MEVSLGRSAVRTAGGLLALCAAAVPLAPGVAASGFSVRERETVVLRIRPLTATPVDLPAGGAFTVEVDPLQGGSLEFSLRWPDDSTTSRVSLRAQPGAPDVIRLEARLELPDGRVQESSRDLICAEKATALFELARVDGRSLTLAVEAERLRQTVFSARPSVGQPVLLHLEVLWLEDSRATSLETNRLSTFLGESVSYSFKLGETGQSLEVRLLPQRIFGDLIELRAEVSGSVLRGERLELVSRNEQWMLSQGQSSSLDVGASEPPTGFRFVVTPSF